MIFYAIFNTVTGARVTGWGTDPEAAAAIVPSTDSTYQVRSCSEEVLRSHIDAHALGIIAGSVPANRFWDAIDAANALGKAGLCARY